MAGLLFLKCVVCQKVEFDANTLTCYHVICKTCFETFFSELRGDGNCITCPFCHRLTESIPGSTLTFQEIAVKTLYPSDEEYLCSVCDKEGVKSAASLVCSSCKPPKKLCISCSEWHSRFTSNHSMLTVEEHVSQGGVFLMQNAPTRVCPWHTSKEVEVSCTKCKLYMCLLCGSVRKCVQSDGSNPKHDLEGMEEADGRVKVKVEEAVGQCSENIQTLCTMAATIEEEISGVDQSLQGTKRKRSALSNMWVDCEREMEKYEGELEKCTEQSVMGLSEITNAREANVRGVRLGERALRLGVAEQMEETLTEIRSLQDRPEGIPSTSSLPRPAEVHLSYLKKMHNFLSRALLIPLIVNYRTLSGDVPWDCRHIVTSSGRYLIEALHGLFFSQLLLVDDFERTMSIGKSCRYASVWASEDGSEIICSTYGSPCMLLTYTFRSRSNISVRKQRSIAGNSARGFDFSASGRLAHVSYSTPHVSVYDAAGNLTYGISDGLSSPRYLVWSRDEKMLYVTNRGEQGRTDGFVCCVIVKSSSVVWRSSLVQPWGIRLIQGKLYITHCSYDADRRPTQLTVLDANTGTLEKVIDCPGMPREIYSEGLGEITVVSYEGSHSL